MKKILIAIALVAATTIANAQFVVSLQLSGPFYIYGNQQINRC